MLLTFIQQLIIATSARQNEYFISLLDIDYKVYHILGSIRGLLIEHQ